MSTPLPRTSSVVRDTNIGKGNPPLPTTGSSRPTSVGTIRVPSREGENSNTRNNGSNDLGLPNSGDHLELGGKSTASGSKKGVSIVGGGGETGGGGGGGGVSDGTTGSGAQVGANEDQGGVRQGMRFKMVAVRADTNKKTTTKKLELGVRNRTAMGEYIAKKGVGLSSLSYPSPGPLDYDPQLLPSGFQYSILGKHINGRKSDHENVPGPNQYSIRSFVFSESPKWSLAQKLANKSNKAASENPSPFAYNDTHKTFGSDGYAYTMSGWFPTVDTETPGPDRYFPRPSTHPLAGASPKFSFGLKTVTFEERTPGPQDYVPQIIQPKSPSYTIRPRVGQNVFTEKEDASRPGCNQYYPQLPLSEKAASLKGWSKDCKALKTPGPANYIMPNTLFSGPQYSLSYRYLPEDEEHFSPPPGPTDYNPTSTLTLDRSPKYSLGQRWRERPSKSAELPGPGTYQPKDRQISVNDRPKVTLKGRYSTKIESTPGPADYNTSKISTPAKISSKKNDRKKEAPKVDSVKPKVKETPGPADYEVVTVDSVKRCGPKYTLSKRINELRADETPPPNAYNSRSKPEGPKISMKSRMSPFVMVFPTNRVDTLRAN
ncbi:hypothetical protein HDV05_006760 [Chytridiales sp. JEL 0842]|nr:hypothetical protein HDV05_006760 [Chytridiales sp. JEL 0842]